jgi:hypothetical protein
MENDKLTDLALLFKERDNPSPFQAGTAFVVQENPLVLKMEDSVFLAAEYNNVVWSKSILAGYKRDFLINPVYGVTDVRSGGSGDPAFASHDHAYKADITGSITWTDNPKIGDEYIVIPINNGNMWYVFDKAVRL